jgi:hypothetical protein
MLFFAIYLELSQNKILIQKQIIMKTTIKEVSLSINLEEINEAIDMFLQKNDFVNIRHISLDDIKKFIGSGELVISAKKMGLKKVEQENEIVFPKSFLSRVGSSTTGLDMLLTNISASQVQKITNDVYSLLSKEDREFLVFVYNLNTEQSDFKEVKNLTEIKERFNVEFPQKRKNEIISKLSKKLNEVIEENLFNGSLKPENNFTTEALLAKPLSEFNFSIRTRNGLRAYDLKTVGDLWREKRPNAFVGFRNFGKFSIQEVKNFKTLYRIN